MTSFHFPTNKLTLKSLFTLCQRMMRQQMGTDVVTHLPVSPFSSFSKKSLLEHGLLEFFIKYVNIPIPQLGRILARSSVHETSIKIANTYDHCKRTLRVHSH